ncbi:hypothetical protein EVAR_88091_1 [Eumeta japonica]|uniref:Uncharacterized protein n=1 Tax=Eumeta variegata TaxID=151549 RepID=A0A4C1WJG6_EUMVA|nr:hypothetical protein EVAR_88091_1 [Eumeta japonica]
MEIAMLGVCQMDRIHDENIPRRTRVVDTVHSIRKKLSFRPFAKHTFPGLRAASSMDAILCDDFHGRQCVRSRVAAAPRRMPDVSEQFV